MARGYRIRRARAGDVAALARLRVSMYRSMMPVPDRVARDMERGTRRFLRRALPRGEFVGWVASKDGGIVAVAGVTPRSLMPRPRAPRGGMEAYLLNVYTEPAHRRRGLARRLTCAALAWARREGAIQVSLGASPEGRPLYEGLGFVPLETAMRLVLRGPGAARRRSTSPRAP
jgi:GNAT superfamily N-acetyltransferase